MSSCVAELDANLQLMLAMKAPGVTGSKISSITSLCVTNIQVRSARGATNSVLVKLIFAVFDVVRICSDPEGLHPLQKSTGDTQARGTLCCRFSDTTVARTCA